MNGDGDRRMRKMNPELLIGIKSPWKLPPKHDIEAMNEFQVWGWHWSINFNKKIELQWSLLHRRILQPGRLKPNRKNLRIHPSGDLGSGTLKSTRKWTQLSICLHSRTFRGIGLTMLPQKKHIDFNPQQRSNYCFQKGIGHPNKTSKGAIHFPLTNPAPLKIWYRDIRCLGTEDGVKEAKALKNPSQIILSSKQFLFPNSLHWQLFPPVLGRQIMHFLKRKQRDSDWLSL